MEDLEEICLSSKILVGRLGQSSDMEELKDLEDS
jgi:hypothetical protein